MLFHLLNRRIAIILMGASLLSFGQTNFQGQAYYESKTTIDMNNFGGGQLSEERKKQIADRMKSALEKTYVLIFNQTESLYREEERLEAPGQGRGFRFGMMSTGGDLYKNVKLKQYLQEQELMGKQFLVKDSLQDIKWQLGSETKTIGQYTCFKATATKKADFDFSPFRRRPANDKPQDSTNTQNDKKNEEDPEPSREVVVTVWYTPQIPINQGPDTYWGLPGLILEVNADRTTILCSKIIINPSDKETIKVPSKGKEVSQSEYDQIMKEKTEEMREMFRGRGGRGGGRRP
ncbi:GLPGLI family protein [Aestuariivivens sediminis]|uniref:GLPGLI family protein n=1 Tax=Aestuariivivens sediminis TaxID=2913557 RepID=UPI001F55F11E|nr:GLPGLI family protein [Aestuariivivens sediminis]